MPLRLVHVEEWPNTPEVPLPYVRDVTERAESLLRDAADRARKDHIGPPCEALLGFSFAEAARRGLPLRFLHSWTLPASYGYAAVMDPGIGKELGDDLHGGLDGLLEPWRKRYAGVEVEAETVVGSSAYQLVEASQTARLVIVGRRSRNVPLGPHLGHVAHAVIHHSPAPVAVVPLMVPLM
ncbi:hypothetical protein ASC82_12900 [Streptomyces sp. Root431]|uniref:universal stress protein n=1 Tax=Streptomyces sp. Root431 TaxID=1736535 RepID=UPI0006F94412|nr:universal stress protein [Streptomyces sp. Root431]KQX12152.1 hypothetical protein ASC82_12900 [Streptomyces sp. Root431]